MSFLFEHFIEFLVVSWYLSSCLVFFLSSVELSWYRFYPNSKNLLGFCCWIFLICFCDNLQISIIGVYPCFGVNFFDFSFPIVIFREFQSILGLTFSSHGIPSMTSCGIDTKSNVMRPRSFPWIWLIKGSVSSFTIPSSWFKGVPSTTVSWYSLSFGNPGILWFIANFLDMKFLVALELIIASAVTPAN